MFKQIKDSLILLEKAKKYLKKMKNKKLLHYMKQILMIMLDILKKLEILIYYLVKMDF